ncbi:DUF2637 domain-containing protein [Kribbella sp. NPDC020789]
MSKNPERLAGLKAAGVAFSRIGGRVLFAVPFAVVVLAPAVASWHGLVEMGHSWLGLSGAWAALVPLTIDSAALYLALLAWRSTLAGDSAGLDRALVWVYAVTSAGLQVWFHDANGGLRSAVFYAIASVSAALLWERTLKALRRRELRALGAIDSPAPRFRVLRWVFHTRETFGAWKLAIGEGISSPHQALELYRGVEAALNTSSPRDDEATDEDTLRELFEAANGQVAPELAGQNKSQSLAIAFRELDEFDVPAARRWLAERGVWTDRSFAYKRARALTAATQAPKLSVVGAP